MNKENKQIEELKKINKSQNEQIKFFKECEDVKRKDYFTTLKLLENWQKFGKFAVLVSTVFFCIIIFFAVKLNQVDNKPKQKFNIRINKRTQTTEDFFKESIK